MKHVMIVDHDSTILKLAEQALQKKYKVSTFKLGNHVIEFVKKSLPDLLMLEASILETDSLSIYKKILEDPILKELPVIFLIEGNNLEMEQKVLSLGAVEFIIKPFAPETLISRVDIQLELQSYRTNGTEAEKFQDAISISFAELVEFRDETTGGHLKNTTQYFKILLEEMFHAEEYKKAIPIEDRKALLRSAPLHDIGKIGINDDILRKASPLDYHEFEYMKTHTTLGKQAFEKIIQETGGSRWLYLAKDMAYCHHERWDGTGYPNGLKGEEIPLYARVLTIADVYDALTSTRTYKDAYTHKAAMDIIIEGKGSLFDPNLVDIFVKVNKRFKQVLARKQ